MKEKNMKKSRPVIRPDDKRLAPALGDGRGRPGLGEAKRVAIRTVFAPSVLDQATQAAKEEGISRSEWIERAVVAALANGGK